MKEKRFTKKEIHVLRDLGRRVAEIGNDPVQQRKAVMWRRHNDLERERPLVLIFPEGAWRELLPRDRMTCPPGLAQDYEYDLRVRLYYAEHLQDDNVIEPIVASPIFIQNSGWGLQGNSTHSADPLGAYHIDPVLRKESDVDRISIPRISVDWPATRARFEKLREVFEGILSVEQQGQGNCGLAPLDHYAGLRGIDQMFMDLVDNPGLVHRAVGRLVEGHLAMLKAMEALGVLTLGNRRHYTGSGGTGYTKALPAPGFDGQHVRLCDLWGHATAQIFAEVSPAMHEEFALRHEQRVLELFGLNCYGCCEPLHHKLASIKRYVPRLRRVSIAPWADVAVAARELGGRYIFSWKPNPAVVAGEGWDRAAVRRGIRDFLRTTRGCVVEMILKDTHTCRHEPRRMREWVRIAKEEAEAFAA